MMQKHLHGLVAAPFTPFNSDSTVNLAMVPRLADLLCAQNVIGAFVCGTTGEGSSMLTSERKDVAAAWVKAAAGRLKVIVHVGHNSVAEAAELARHAQSIGADAVAGIAPSFFKPASLAALVETSRVVAAAAPQLPFYYYHIPSMTGVDFSMAAFVPLALERIPTFAGVKFTHENVMDFSRAVAAGGERSQVMFGRDEILLAGLSVGATAAVGSTYNYAGALYQDVIAAFRAGDGRKAAAQQLRAMDFIAAFVPYGGVNAQKAMMKMLGFDCGPSRLPLQDLAPDRVAALKADLEKVGFFAYAAAAKKLGV